MPQLSTTNQGVYYSLCQSLPRFCFTFHGVNMTKTHLSLGTSRQRQPSVAPRCPNSRCGYSILKSLGFAVSSTASSSPHGSDTP